MFDFNKVNAAPVSMDPLPDGTLVDCIVTVQPGGYNDLDRGYTDGYARDSEWGVHLNLKLKVVDGEFKNRVFFDKIYLPCSIQTDEYKRKIDRSAVKAKGILCSHHGIDPRLPSDMLEQIQTLSQLVNAIDGTQAIVRVNLYNGKNSIKYVLTPADIEYADFRDVKQPTIDEVMGGDDVPF